jgi:hypothetical protein
MSISHHYLILCVHGLFLPQIKNDFQNDTSVLAGKINGFLTHYLLKYSLKHLFGKSETVEVCVSSSALCGSLTKTMSFGIFFLSVYSSVILYA